MEFQEKKRFLKNFDNFFFCENDLSVIFGFLTPKLIKVPIFTKIQSTKLEIWTKMYCDKFPRWPPRGQKRGIVIQSFDHNISEIIWDRCLKFGTFTYPHSMYLCSKFHWNLKRRVSGMSHFDVEFPICIFLYMDTINQSFCPHTGKYRSEQTRILAYFMQCASLNL